MNQRLIWNFEFYPQIRLHSWDKPHPKNQEDTKWEARYFWPEHQTVPLQAMNSALMDIANYEHKHREDYYYLLPQQDYNIKRRNGKLLYKPLLQKTAHALGFGKKIDLNLFPYSFLHELKQRVDQKAQEIYVKKEVFIYTFSSTPKIKLELARLEIADQIYLSACVEGKSQLLVEEFSHLLLPQQVSCDYIRFLKQIIVPS